MADQYVATDTRTGLEVTVTGTFPADPEDRVRIARTTTLFTRLMSTILSLDEETPRRAGFRAIETQLEVAEALIRGEMQEVQRLVRETLGAAGITDDQLKQIEDELRRRFEGFDGLDELGGPRGLGSG